MNKIAKRGLSPHAQLLIAQAKIDEISPALVLAKYFSPAIFEIRSGLLGDWDHSVILGEGILYLKADGNDTLLAKRKCKIEIIQGGIPTWFCIKSKKDPKIYWIGTCGGHGNHADLLMSNRDVIKGQPSTLNTMQISGL
jgi:hypothetical protein